MEAILASKLVQIYDHFDQHFSRIVHVFCFLFGWCHVLTPVLLLVAPHPFFQRKYLAKCLGNSRYTSKKMAEDP